LILLHNFKVFALKIKRGTKARVSPASLKVLEGWEPLRGDGVQALGYSERVEPTPICLATWKNGETAPLALLDQQ
jgi:hypothetical protein